MVTEPTRTFTRKFWGYEPTAVDAHIETLTAKQQLLRDDVENLRARLRDSGDQAAALRKEVALLTETSSTPHAVQQRMAKMLRSAVDEVAQMQAEARAEADALIAAAEAEAEAERRRHEELVAEMIAQQKALQAENEEAQKKLDAEMADLRAETRSAIDEAWQNSQQERDQLLADAKQQADYEREQAQRAVDEARAQRIRILEQLMAVYRDLDAVPVALEQAYQDAQAVASQPEEKVSTS
ncbi:cell division protein DivIVA [Mycobacterium asiaticum]|uniref:Cell division protein DivIVA n=1 Tax=Mycobacterium asiaticum TaxID=1790 RepID=A0A1A3MLI8_MYCAS|nr:cell division protein DivIVA [Mycobacterium asiaticum]OBK09900.1 cell division protein DivIVA [Mycobacterium asiaticum]